MINHITVEGQHLRHLVMTNLKPIIDTIHTHIMYLENNDVGRIESGNPRYPSSKIPRAYELPSRLTPCHTARSLIW